MTDKPSSRTPKPAKPADPESEFADWPIEKCFEELETIVAALEGDTIPLEESLNLFERGMLLSRRCSRELSSIEKKIKLVIENSRGEVQLEDFEPDSGDD